jgi:hypothetical protein
MKMMKPRKMISLTRRVLVARFMGTIPTAPHFRGPPRSPTLTKPSEFTAADAREMAARLSENARWLQTAADFYDRLADSDKTGARAEMVRFRESMPNELVPETALLRVITGVLLDCEDV